MISFQTNQLQKEQINEQKGYGLEIFSNIGAWNHVTFLQTIL